MFSGIEDLEEENTDSPLGKIEQLIRKWYASSYRMTGNVQNGNKR